MTHEQILNTFLILMICLFVFAIIRELICWYFKINKRVELQEKILNELIKINATPEGTDHLFITKYGDKL